MPEFKPFPVADKIADLLVDLTNLPLEEACQPCNVRHFFNNAAAQIEKAPVEREDRKIQFDNIEVEISILRPIGSKGKTLPVILFLHGGGWVIGDYNTHGNLTNELVNQVPACVVFVSYSYSPENKYPIALEECYAALRWIQENGASISVDTKRICVAGDSAGGNLSVALTLLAKQRKNNGITFQLLYYPVLDVNFETESYQKYKDDIFLPRRTMEYVWEAYMNDPSKDKYVSTVVPMAAAPEELVGLPPALIVTAERDVLRDEGEAFAKRLAAADVPCLSIRFQGVGHGFVTMPVLKAQAHGAILQSVDSLRKAWNQNDSKM